MSTALISFLSHLFLFSLCFSVLHSSVPFQSTMVKGKGKGKRARSSSANGRRNLMYDFTWCFSAGTSRSGAFNPSQLKQGYTFEICTGYYLKWTSAVLSRRFCPCPNTIVSGVLGILGILPLHLQPSSVQLAQHLDPTSIVSTRPIAPLPL